MGFEPMMEYNPHTRLAGKNLISQPYQLIGFPMKIRQPESIMWLSESLKWSKKTNKWYDW